MASAANVKIKQLVELEDIQREELKWEEEHSRCAARISFLKKCKIIHKQLDAVAKKQEIAVKRSHETLLRRIDTLITEEQRSRLYIMQNEALRLEGILRNLEEGIREAIFSAAYDVQQRIKYFNKTVEMITKSEVSERKIVVGAERYEWLVMFQRFDGTRLKILRQEVVEKVRAEKAAKHDKAREATVQQINTTGASQQQQKMYGGASLGTTQESAASLSPLPSFDASTPPTPRSGRKGADFRQNSKTSSPNASARIVVRHNAEAKEKMRRTIEEQETLRRTLVVDEEERGWFTFTRFVDFIAEREARYTRVDVNAEELAKCRTRRLQVTQKQEAQEREEIVLLEAVTFQGFQRKLNRIKLEDSKFQETEQIRQMGHEQRLAHRYNRITLQQMAFAEREKNAINDLLHVRKEETPIIVQQMMPDSTTISSDQSRERRQFFKREESARKQILQEETTYIHIFYAEMLAMAGDGDATAARIKAAQQRREEKERQDISKIQKKLDSTVNKTESLQRQSKLKSEGDRILRAEMQERVKINQDHFDWHVMLTTSLKLASRMAALHPAMHEEEARLRLKLVSQERNLRESYAQAFKLGFKPKTKQPLPPLPAPPANFEKAKLMYASIKSQTARGMQSGMRSSTRSNGSYSARSSTGAQTPHLPPIENRSQKAPTRKFLSNNSTNRLAPSTHVADNVGESTAAAQETVTTQTEGTAAPKVTEREVHSKTSHEEVRSEYKSPSQSPSRSASQHSRNEDEKSNGSQSPTEKRLQAKNNESSTSDSQLEQKTNDESKEEEKDSKQGPPTVKSQSPSEGTHRSSRRSSKDSSRSQHLEDANNAETGIFPPQSTAEEEEL